MSLIVTGSIGIDTVMTPTARAENVLGGSCIYFAAAASFFTDVRVVGAVGEDFPSEHLAVFDRFGICVRGLEQRQGSQTFRWTGRYHENMNDRDTVEVQQNVLAEPLPPVPAEYADSRYVFLANTHPAAQIELRDQFPQASLVVADTMDLWIDTALADLKLLLTKIDGLVLNDSEARQLTGESNMVVASSRIVEMGPKFVVIKKGEHGCLLNHTDGIGVLHAFPAANVVDPTGAGDSFAGGMMGYLAETGNLTLAGIKRSLAYGTIVASFNIESFSLDRLSEISRRDIDQRLDEYADAVRFD
ncbi:MAG: PfkB family carbohydrate kinase [Phycisphaerae bacterium]|nr:PfkB family carbohydrate kinase [Phycisphaerae bacterium]